MSSSSIDLRTHFQIDYEAVEDGLFNNLKISVRHKASNVVCFESHYFCSAYEQAEIITEFERKYRNSDALFCFSLIKLIQLEGLDPFSMNFDEVLQIASTYLNK